MSNKKITIKKQTKMLKKIIYVSLLATSTLMLNSCGMGKLISIKPMDSEGISRLENGYLSKVESTFKVMENTENYISSGAFDAFSSNELKNVEKIEKFYSSSMTQERRDNIAKIISNSVPNLRDIVTAKIKNFSAVDHGALINGNLSNYLKESLYNELLKSAQNSVKNSNISFDRDYTNTIISSNDLSKIKSLNSSLNKKLIAEQIVNSFFGILAQQK